MHRMYVDCREFPSDINCTVAISGTPDEVLKVATEHAVSTHGHQDSPELRETIRGMMKEEVTA